MFMIPFVAIFAAMFLLLPMVKNAGGAAVKARLLINSGIFMVAAALMVGMTALGVSAEQSAQTDTPTYSNAGVVSGESEDYSVSYVDNRANAANEASNNNQGMGYLAAALATGLSCLGAGIAIASTAPAAIGAFSEDPKAFGKALIFVVLGEGVALYGLLISILLINKL